MNIPAAFEFKRVFPTNRTFFNVLGELDAFMTAPVYSFPDQEGFDCGTARKLCSDPEGLELRLPHERVIFEVPDGGNYQSAFVCCRQRGTDVEAFLILKALARKEWVAPIIRAVLHADGELEVEANTPDCPDERSAKIYTQVVVNLVVNAVNILARQPDIQNISMPMPHRRRFEKAGVRGWIWHTVRIDPSKLTVRGPPLGGTHATPRWHIRRGHWRNLVDGRRVVVRECEVGDKSRGGVVKDYEVAA